ncbi:hypothetical protein PL373_08095 [Tenacibaculum maritimum]|nr:hypothetical protein [Tenacibaculum maritimum]MDB0601106.1 hypothetical protein [Tenacibaculum maritimum]MDB0612188.1 hypothetical protein [Tenacibaculum maritimum]
MIEKQEILNRISKLRDAIAYSRHEQKIMSLEEGILCNYEIACWFRVLDGEVRKPKYVVTDTIESKVTQINEQIEVEAWKRPKEL